MDPGLCRLNGLVSRFRSILQDLGLTPDIEVQPADSCWLVSIDWDGDDPDGSTFLVSRFTDWVLALDPNGEDLTDTEWPTYLALRATGLSRSRPLAWCIDGQSVICLQVMR
ncbi:hypothetical protein [Streptacidiphilus monticola]|uniref:Uncharacterized protein n=1 Tax=Streptacidiphilus monticola TaxID=2161674 RepID=A0ABW1G6V7_9ACTN